VRRWARSLLAAAAILVAPNALAKRPLRPEERIDLNRASAAELMRLPGVGAKRAQAIVAKRARRPFRTPTDVLAVKGLGKTWFRAVKAHLVATSATPAAPPTTTTPAGPAPTTVASR
jgi:competence protein ComEA